MSKTINDVRAEILKEFKIDVSADVIRRDQKIGLFDVPRDENNNFRMYSEDDVNKIKFIILLRDLGIERECIKEVLEGNKQVAWDKIHQLTNTTIPALKGRL